ncbi:subtilisin-like protease [Hordeum vulgare]|nr:subtilisin-like protease [Hordeum vulgare]
MYTHDTVMHGFAVRVTDEEAARMSRVPGVSGVYKDRAYHTQTTRSSGFLGLHEEFGAWPDSDFGDNGISPESASFDDGGLGPMRPTWKGKCTDAEGFNASLCNNGAKRNADFYDDIVAVATFGAEHRGVFVVLAGSNQGAEASSVTNVAPWMTPVGAATTDRLFPPTLKLGNGAELGGHLVHHDVPWREHDPASVQRLRRERAGGAGIVDVGFYERLLDGVDGQTFTLPGVTLGYTEFKKLEAYMASVPYPVTSFRFTCDTVTGENRAPTVAGFSSLGPNTVVPEILKPDVIAPGVNILAAWSGDATPTDSEEDPRRVEYNILSGTSMACPHVTGAAALVKKRHGAGPLPWYGRR